MHICPDEIYALMQSFPFLSNLATRLRLWWHSKHKTCKHPEPHVTVISEGPPKRSAVDILRNPPKLNLSKTGEK